MKRTVLAILASIIAINSFACTSAIVSGKASLSGKPILWKHRDTGAEQNFVTRVDAKDGKIKISIKYKRKSIKKSSSVFCCEQMKSV